MSRYPSSHNNHNGYHHNHQVPPPNYPSNNHNHHQPQQYNGHHNSTHSTSDNRYKPYRNDRDHNHNHNHNRDRDRDRSDHMHRSSRHRSNDRDDHHRSRNRDRDRDRDSDRHRHDRNDRNDRNNHRNYDRNNHGFNRGGGRGGFRGRGRGGFRGGFRGRGRGGRGRGRGGFASKEKYEIQSLNARLIENIKALALDKRGTQPLRTWIDLRTNSEYHEARFKKDSARMTRDHGKQVNESIKINEIPSSAQLKWENNSEAWLEGLPIADRRHALTFKESVAVTTSCIQIEDGSLTVHQYTFDFVKKINDENVDGNSMEMDDKKDVKDVVKVENVNGNVQNVNQDDCSVEEKRRVFYSIRLKLRSRGFAPFNFDNRHIFSFSNNIPTDPILQIQKGNYAITLERQYSTDPKLQCNNNNKNNIKQEHKNNIKQEHKENSQKSNFFKIYKQCSMQFHQQGLNILNRKRFNQAKMFKLHRKEETFYSIQDLSSHEVWPQNGTSLEYPDLRLLLGYKSTIVHTKHMIIKNQIKHKLICRHSLHDLIKDNGVEAVDNFIRGKRAITSYSDQIVEMVGLDPSLNLDSTFSARDGVISYRDYYTKKKKDFRTGKKVDLFHKQEEALVIHNKYEGRGKERRVSMVLHFLPQLLYVIVPVEQHNDQTKLKLRKRSHPSVGEVIGKSLEINSVLSKANKRKMFTTQDRPIQVKGYILQPPLICFKSRGGIRREKATTFGGRIWKDVDDFWYNLRSIYENKPPKHRPHGIDWAICFDSNSHNGEPAARDIENFLHQFNQQRRFTNAPLNAPAIIGLDYTNLPEIRGKLRHSNFSVAVFILPEHTMGCKYKVDITRHVLHANEPSTALSTPTNSPKTNRIKRNNKRHNHLSMDLQFINVSTVRKKNAVYNVFETVLLKSKVILYTISPQLPSNKFNYKSLWMIGIKILRKKGGCHLLVLNCNRAPFVGALKYITNHSAMISGEQDVIPQHMMQQLSYDLLKTNLKKIIASNGDEHVPHNIVILRCSGGDGLLKQIISKEVAGFKKALYEFCKREKDLIKEANNKCRKWYPGVIFSVLQENCPDAWGFDAGDGRIVDSEQAICVNEGITSSQYFDVFISLPSKQERQLYTRVIRLVTLMDEYNNGRTKDGRADKHDRLSVSPKLLSDFVCLLYSSIWGYCLNIPFPKVPNYPSPINFAQHYASWQYGILTNDDTSLKELMIDVDNAKPRVCNIKNGGGSGDNDIVMKI